MSGSGWFSSSTNSPRIAEPSASVSPGLASLLGANTRRSVDTAAITMHTTRRFDASSHVDAWDACTPLDGKRESETQKICCHRFAGRIDTSATNTKAQPPEDRADTLSTDSH